MFESYFLPIFIALLFNRTLLREARLISELYQGLSSALTVTVLEGMQVLIMLRKYY